MAKLPKLLQELKRKANPQLALGSLRFIKTGKGQYGEKNKFLGIRVSDLRLIAKKYGNLSLLEIDKLLKNKYDEIKFVALLILIHQYNNKLTSKFNSDNQKLYRFYLNHTNYINSWGLVDISAHCIVGDYLLNKDKRILEKLAKSKNLWERRIAIVSTFAFINNGEFIWTFKIVKILLNDQEDLIHKACGWMLREVGKKVSQARLETFLDVYSTKMPRTMLRYSIERFSKIKRKYYLTKKRN